MKNGKYSNELVYNYLAGNDIDNYNIDELENDYEFMIDVFEVSSDKKMYSLCSENVKNNYNFVKYIVNKFKDDTNFICDIADTYLNKCNDDYEKTELNIVMFNLTRRTDRNLNYATIASATYLYKLLQIECTKQKYENEEDLINEIQAGFWFIIDEYGNNKVILDYFARGFIGYICESNSITVEKYLHNNYKNGDNIKLNGINNVIIEFISTYDSYLGQYVSNNLNVIDDLKKDVNKAIKNWDIYEARTERDKYLKLFEDFSEYIESNELEFYSEAGMLYFIVNEFGLISELKKYDIIDDEMIDELLNDTFIDKGIMSLDEYRHYNNLRKIVIDDLELNICDNISYNKPTRKENKIIKLFPNNKE